MIEKFRKSCYGSYLSKEEEDLFGALFCQDLAKTKTLLRQVRNINAQTKPHDIMTGESILHYIVENSCNNPGPGWTELLEEVLSKYSATNSTSAINVNIVSEPNGTPLYVACKLGNLDVVNLLLEHGADPNVYGFVHKPLHYALKEDKIDLAKTLLKHGAKTIGLRPYEIIDFSKNAVEVLLPYLSDAKKDLMLKELISYDITTDDSAEADHDIEIAKLLLNAGVDPNRSIHHADPKKKSKLVKLCNEYKKSIINNPQKQSSGGRWAIIVPALLFGAIGAVLAATGVIPEIAAIGVIATSVLSGIAGAVIGGVAGYLVDVAISQCCDNQQCAA
ncbi:MAG: ankyrin repeat domain-containing protein [Rickettsiales bacterium]|nr:ankyrin repeat domain-containing protein [Rickettsiales bacterium]